MLKKIPATSSTLKISSDKECFKIKEHVKTASRMKVLEFKEKNAGPTEKDGQALSSKFVQKHNQIMNEIISIMEKVAVMESSPTDFEGLYKSILFISRDSESMEALIRSINSFAESYHFIEFESL